MTGRLVSRSESRTHSTTHPTCSTVQYLFTKAIPIESVLSPREGLLVVRRAVPRKIRRGISSASHRLLCLKRRLVLPASLLSASYPLCGTQRLIAPRTVGERSCFIARWTGIMTLARRGSEFRQRNHGGGVVARELCARQSSKPNHQRSLQESFNEK